MSREFAAGDVRVWESFGLRLRPGNPLPEMVVTYVCECSFVSAARPVDDVSGKDELREHLVDEHPGAIMFRRCEACGTVTDYFRAHVPDLGTDTWLCDDHGPKIPIVTDQTGNDTEEIQWASD